MISDETKAIEHYCGECKHWHFNAEMTGEYKCRQGNCDKVPKGQPYSFEINGKHHDATYDGWSFEDECYSDVFNCFEEREE